ncbi:MAG: hypothetical protein ABIR11_06360 [Candidatus Limnocylindrales bacterium]
MPNVDRLYRAMMNDADGLPMLDESARTLGARPQIDVPDDAADDVESGTGGMSVAIGSPSALPAHRRPPALGGSGRDRVYSIGTGELGAELRWRRDPVGPSGHGFIEPVRRMAFSDYQAALWATRPHWEEVLP